MRNRYIILTLNLMMTALAFAPSDSSAFELPKRDPWFFQSTEAGYNFWIPDKAQHYYGSMLVTETFKRLSLPAENVTVPALAFTAGFFWEVMQERKGAGFSRRDLFADALGVASSQFSSRTVKLWVDYSTNEGTITFNITKRFG